MDVPSGLIEGATEFVRADYTVTFSAPKAHMVLPPLAEHIGELIVGRIGTTDELLGDTQLHLSQLADFSALLRPRPRDSHKGTFGHVLVVGGGEGKTSGGRHPVSPWGKPEGRTRDKTKPSQQLIVRRRRTRGSRR